MNKKTTTTKYNGYVTLISVIIIMAISVTLVISFLLVSTTSLNNAKSQLNSVRAREAADSCVDVALNKLRTNQSYAAGETFSFNQGITQCEIVAISGSGNTNRTLQVEATSGEEVFRVTVVISQINPTTVITSYTPVATF